MSATDTALRLMLWTTEVTDGRAGKRRAGDRWAGERWAGPPRPGGDLADTTALADPPGAVREAAVRLAAVTAARLRLPVPPFGDPRPVTTGVVLLAAACGAWGRPGAADLLAAVDPPASAAESLARHGLATALLASGPEPALADAVRDASPLTGLLDAPTPAGRARCELLLDDIQDAPDGRRLVTTVFAEPPAGAGQSRWRGEALNDMLSLGADGRERVLDVYETAMAQHAPGHRERVQDAAGRLRRPIDLAAAAPTARWWQALARLDHTHRERLRDRHALRGYRPGLDLYWRVLSLGGLD